MIDASQTPMSEILPNFSIAVGQPLARVEQWFDELRADTSFLSALNAVIADEPAFAGKQFRQIEELRPYRCLLYLLVRATRPEHMVETGVHNGLGTAFILLAMKHNAAGQLHSIDLPPQDERMLAQGNRAMPPEKISGWLIPENLRERHELLLGRAETLLPEVLGRLGAIDVFLHDSDHSYAHMAFELGLAWSYLRPGGYCVCDNVEANALWSDFTRGVQAPNWMFHSFNSASRVWAHGLLRKPT